jgi:hypothetical protein
MFEVMHLSDLSCGRVAAVAGRIDARNRVIDDGAPPGATVD